VPGSNPKFLELLRVLTRHRVDFIVVGGVSAVLHGAPVTTFDLDVVHARNPENVARLLAALDELEAVYRAPVEPLPTKFGPLEILGMIGKSRTWEDLNNYTRAMEIEPGVIVRALDLEILIAVKAELGFPKDVAMLPVLRQAFKEQSS
jgi:hypothetical protein